MKQALYSNECISAEKQSIELNLRSYREEAFWIISLKTVTENLNLVKSYDKTNPNVFNQVFRRKNLVIKMMNIGGQAGGWASCWAGINNSFPKHNSATIRNILMILSRIIEGYIVGQHGMSCTRMTTLHIFVF